MVDPFRAAGAVIDAAFAEPVLYSGGGLAEPKALKVIWSDTSGDPFQGFGNTTRIISAEIRQADLPAKPMKSDRIERGGVVWQPNDVTRRDDIGKWIVIMEEVQ